MPYDRAALLSFPSPAPAPNYLQPCIKQPVQIPSTRAPAEREGVVPACVHVSSR